MGTFDETQDGIGNPVVNTPLFRQDLAAPYGTAGEFAVLDNIGNASYTSNLDPTTLVTPEGLAFLKIKAGALGEELANNYAQILKKTGVTGHPFVQATLTGKPGELANPIGRRVDNQKLLDMNAYLDSLPAPNGEDRSDRRLPQSRNVSAELHHLPQRGPKQNRSPDARGHENHLSGLSTGSAGATEAAAQSDPEFTR